MDSEGRIIPITEDDQGEGYKDIIDDVDALREAEKKSEEFFFEQFMKSQRKREKQNAKVLTRRFPYVKVR